MLRPPKVSFTMFALEATEYANQEGMFEQVHHGLYRAYWADGKDLGDLEVIQEVIENSGLNWPRLRERLESRYYQEKVMSQFSEALAIGIKGIPAYRVGDFLFTGARPYADFKTVIDWYLEGVDPTIS